MMFEYDRDSDGMYPTRVDTDAERIRPAKQRQRCGPYTSPNGENCWGDHRVTWPGTTCVETGCHVAHSPTELPGWPEWMPGWYERPGVRAVAAAFDGWDSAGMLPACIGGGNTWAAAHIALDALRDAGYTITPVGDLPQRTVGQP